MPQTTEYPESHEVSGMASEEFVPPKLKHFLRQIVPGRKFPDDNGDSSNKPEHDRASLVVAECVIYNYWREKRPPVIPPFHVGLAIALHKEFGSQNLIDLLSSFGLCMTYTETRRFLTAKAQEVVDKSQGGVFIPSELTHYAESGKVIQEGDDNLDINTETIDGKDTFHSMARVYFQHAGTSTSDNMSRTKRSGEKTLKVAKGLSVLQYNKPKEKPLPQIATSNLEKVIQGVATLELSDLGWVLLRQCSRNLEKPVIPFWAGFNATLSGRQGARVKATVIVYGPSIEARPADPATVYTTLKQGKLLAEKCGQNFNIHTFDQQLYAVAQTVRLSKIDEFPHTVIHLGGFHTLCCYIACIGKLWGDGGLREILSDSGVYAPLTTEQMLQGKQFHRAIRGLTLVFEAMVAVLRYHFVLWLQEFHTAEYDELQNHLECVHQFGSSSQFTEVFNSLTIFLDSLMPKLNIFLTSRISESETFSFWYKFVLAVQVLLSNIGAERCGNWQQHVHTTGQMIPYFFVANRQNYSRWATLYVSEMSSELPDGVLEAFEEGQFTVHQTSGVFNGVWMDMATECSVIRDSKSESGIVGLTRREAALLRWELTRQITGKYWSVMRCRAGCREEKKDDIHEQTKPSMLARDNADAATLVQYLSNNMTDPFSSTSPAQLVNIATGLVAAPEVASSMQNVSEKGNTMAKEFASRVKVDKQQGFHDPIRRSGVRTFGDMKKATPVRRRGTISYITVSPESVFLRALALAEIHPEVTLASVMNFPLTAVPPAFFTDDGLRRVATKATLLHALEKKADATVAEPPINGKHDAWLLDGMAIVQALPVRTMRTFDDVAQHVTNHVLSRLTAADEVHVVFDNYVESAHSPKHQERLRRQGSSKGRYQVKGPLRLPDWKTFLASPENKRELTHFLCEYLVQHAAPGAGTVFVAGGWKDLRTATAVSPTEVKTPTPLQSSQEEADTRLLLHVYDVDRRREKPGGSVVISSPDTDVLVLLLYYKSKLRNLRHVWFHTGRTTTLLDNRRFLPVHTIAEKLQEKGLTDPLPTIHALTGCDTTSSFYGVGKKTALSVAEKHSQTASALTTLYQGTTEEAIAAATVFTAKLYDTAGKHAHCHESLNLLRSCMAATKCLAMKKIPPSEAAFKQHVLRVSWQVQVWTSAHVPEPRVPDVLEHGWEWDGNCVVPVLFQGPTALENLDRYACKCTSKCTKDCQCQDDGIGCSEVCLCAGVDCLNPHNSKDIETEVS